MSHKDVIDTINWKFNDYVEQCKLPYRSKEDIFIRAFRHFLTLSEFGIFPEKASESLNTLAKLHLGYNLDEINDLVMKTAHNNVNELSNLPTVPLTDAENQAVLEYHKILFGKFQKNEKP